MPVTSPSNPPAAGVHPAVAVSTAIWQASVQRALAQAGQALSGLTNQDVTVKETAEEFIPLDRFPQLAGPEESPMIAGLQEISGSIPGLLLLLFPAEAASRLVQMMLSPYLDEPVTTDATLTADEAAASKDTCAQGTDLPAPGAVSAQEADLTSLAEASHLLEDEMALSVLAEVDNVVGSAFLNVMADSIAGRLIPSPPSVVADMAGALLSTALVSTLERAGRVAETVSVVHTSFGTPDGQVEAMLIWLSAATSAEMLAAAAAAAAAASADASASDGSGPLPVRPV
ncbi:MAG: hypothetical protein IMX01_04625 [Limnochordaceae bacterium]|nr:hypothetical protein [Limnochordaceae bacterium]